jgi:hypothetical protein
MIASIIPLAIVAALLGGAPAADPSPAGRLAEAEFQETALGDLAAAEAICREVLALPDLPDAIHVTALFRLGRVLARKGDAAVARKVFEELAAKFPRHRARAAEEIRALDERRSRPGLEDDWLAEVRSDRGLQAQVASVAIDLASPDPAKARAAAEHLERLGPIALPIAGSLARATGDPLLLRRAASLLFRWGSREWGRTALAAPEEVESLAAWLLRAGADERARFLGDLSAVEGEAAPAGAEPIDPTALDLLRLAAGDFTDAPKRLGRVLSGTRRDPASLRAILGGLARSPEGLTALRAEVLRLGETAPPELLAPWLEAEAAGGGAAIAAFVRTHPGIFARGQRGIYRDSAHASPQLLALIDAVSRMPPVVQRVVVEATPASCLVVFLCTPAQRKEGTYPYVNPNVKLRPGAKLEGSGALFRAIAERAEPKVAAFALENLVNAAGREQEALGELAAYLAGDLAGKPVPASALVPSTEAKVRLLAGLKDHPSKAVRDWAVGCLSMEARDLMNILDAGAAEALLGFLPSAADNLDFSDLPQEYFSLGGQRRTGPRPESAFPGSLDLAAVLPGLARRGAGCDAAMKRRIVDAVLDDFDRRLRPFETLTRDPWPEVVVQGQDTGRAIEDLLPGGAWDLAADRRGLRFLRLRIGLLSSMEAPGRKSWSSRSHDALEGLIRKALDPKADAAFREEAVLFLVAMFRWLDEAGLTAPYRAELRPLAADVSLSPGLRWAALTVAGSLEPERNYGHPLRPRERIPEAASLLESLKEKDPVLERNAVYAAWTLTILMPEERLEDLHRRLAESEIPAFRAWAANGTGPLEEIGMPASPSSPSLHRMSRKVQRASTREAVVASAVPKDLPEGPIREAWPLAPAVRAAIARPLLDDPDPGVARAARSALIRLRDREGLLEALRRNALRTDEDAKEAIQMAHALESLGAGEKGKKPEKR